MKLGHKLRRLDTLNNKIKELEKERKLIKETLINNFFAGNSLISTNKYYATLKYSHRFNIDTKLVREFFGPDISKYEKESIAKTITVFKKEA